MDKLRRQSKASVRMFTLWGLDLATPHTAIDPYQTAFQIEVTDLQSAQFPAPHSCFRSKPIKSALGFFRGIEGPLNLFQRIRPLSYRVTLWQDDVRRRVMGDIAPRARRLPEHLQSSHEILLRFRTDLDS